MVPDGLGKNERKRLDTASPAHIAAGAARLDRYLAAGRWLGVNNAYLRRAVDQLKGLNHNEKARDPKHLTEYIAASAPLHCLEGWAYAGRALAAQGRGQSDTARHLAYYAELRAAMSLLASQGVGIFDDRHVAVARDGEVRVFCKKRTHVATWQVLQALAETRAGEMISPVIAPRGVPLVDWVAVTQGPRAVKALSKKWLTQWGLDLRRFVMDRNARNEASYRPTKIRGLGQLPTADSLVFIQDFWRLLEPFPGEPFRGLDQALLRLALEEAYKHRTGNTPRDHPADYQSEIGGILDETVRETEESPLARYLTRQLSPDDPLLIRYARAAANPLGDDFHLSVLARSVLLLRVASGWSARLLSLATDSNGKQDFLRSEFGSSRALFREPAMAPDEAIDLFLDVAEASEELERLVEDDDASRSYFDLLRLCAEPLSTLESCERIPYWAVAA